MKKYLMLFITSIMILLTTIIYIYNNHNIQISEIKKPSITIKSSKFGEIKNIVWLSNLTNRSDYLIILGNKDIDTVKYSSLYYLNINNGQSELIGQFKAHKNLDDVILFDDPFCSHSIVTAYNKGIVKTNLFYAEDNCIRSETGKISVNNFEDANSMDCKDSIFFSKPNDNLIYVKNSSRDFFQSFVNNNSKPSITKYYRKPYYIVHANPTNKSLTYTSINKKGVDLYAMKYNGTPVSKLNKPLIENIVTAKAISNDINYGFIAMNINNTSPKNNMLNIYLTKDYLQVLNTLDSYKIDTIPFNVDMFGSIPSIDSTIYGSKCTLAYTCFDENHKGKIKICNTNEKPKVIVESKNIFGPIKITEKKVDNKQVKMILYFTYENNKIKANICDINGNLIKDITDMLM